MNIGTVVLLAVIVVLASAGAVLVGSNASLAAPVAAIAVGAAAFLLMGIWGRVRWPSAGTGAAPRSSTTQVRTALAAGKHGRRELIAYLDALERSGFGLATPVLSAEELQHLLSESAEEFHRYLDSRLRDLERRT